MVIGVSLTAGGLYGAYVGTRTMKYYSRQEDAIKARLAYERRSWGFENYEGERWKRVGENQAVSNYGRHCTTKFMVKKLKKPYMKNGSYVIGRRGYANTTYLRKLLEKVFPEDVEPKSP